MLFIHSNLESLHICFHSDYLFGEHLQALFDIILSLNPSNLLDLVKFQLFAHHRAYRKLGWRIHEFLTHWGVLPFDILQNNIDRNLVPKMFHLKGVDSEFHERVRDYVNTNQSMYYPSEGNSCIYWVNAENACGWITGLMGLWSGVQDSLLVKTDGNQWNVKSALPSPKTVKDIVIQLFLFESLMPIFKHLLSAHGVSQALCDASEPGFTYCLLILTFSRAQTSCSFRWQQQ